MKPLSDRVVIVALIAAVGICFALAFWTVRLNPSGEPPLLWRQGPSVSVPSLFS
ncbi:MULTISPECIES: hypothetical protein [unclassified Cyanobium]|uniref:hypothetical protein n=1 Tax=unclassified Cyanobium TaxID=2627006 RepID=UPI0020CEC0BA|nr:MULTISPECIES: hypothetical protein [unclassified Cyanobium]MCP9834602.1 hypothetical protein [Cyanobium sp. La Preciosa 7G6]MCP9937365.1 hypothetical protein [Cyanobium sp. Aljojuca 7A6]